MTTQTLDRSLAGVAANLKRVGTMEGVLWYAVGYLGVFAAIGGTLVALMLVCALPVMVVDRTARDQSESAAMIGFLITGVGGAGSLAAAGVSYGLARLIGRWRRFSRRASLVMAVIVGLPLTIWGLEVLIVAAQALGLGTDPGVGLWLLPLVAVPYGFLVYVFGGGLLASHRLCAMRIAQDSASSEASPVSLADVSGPGPTDLSTLNRSERRNYRRRVLWSFLKAAWLVLGVNFGLQVLSLLFIRNPDDWATQEEADAVLGVFRIFSAVLGFGLIVVLSHRLTRQLHAAQRLLTPSFHEVRERDPRAPVLLLRSFRDEWILTAEGALSFLSSSRTEIRTLEEHLTDRLWRLGPVVAIGRPGETERPSGAAREYLNGVDEADWQRRVEGLAKECRLIVLLAGKTPGVAWELKHLREAGHLDRVVVVIPPWMVDAEWRAFCKSAGAEEAADLQLKEHAQRAVACRWGPRGLVAYRGPSNSYGIEAVAIVACGEIAVSHAKPPAPAAAASDQPLPEQPANQALDQASSRIAQWRRDSRP